MNRREREAFARLRLIGVIRRSRRGYYVAKPSTINAIAREVAGNYGSYREALGRKLEALLRKGKGLDIIRMMGDSVLDYLDIDKLSLGELRSLYEGLRGDAAREAIAHRIARRVKKEGVSKADAEKVLDILGRHSLLDVESVRRILSAEPRLAQQLSGMIGYSTMLDLAADMEPTRAATLVSRAQGKRSYRAAYEMLARFGKIHEAGDMDERSLSLWEYVARAFQSIVEYLASGSEGYLEAAEYYLARVSGSSCEGCRYAPPSTIVSDLLEAVEAAREGLLTRSLSLIVKYMEPFEATQLLVTVGASRRELRRAALFLVFQILRRVRGESKGRVVKKQWLQTAYGERVDVRASLFNMVRLASEPIVRLGRRHAESIVLALDKSGSMRPYSFYSVLVASSFAPLIKRLVVFDERVTVYPNRLIRGSSWRKIIEMIISTDFSGYTDVVGALREATKGLTPHWLVVISDLRQTVASRDSVIDVLRELGSRGWKIAVIAPANARIPREVRSLRGVYVYVVEKPRDVARIVLKIASRI
jgi:uncharacterized protein with von Willebrand factor type A (vWA) domain